MFGPNSNCDQLLITIRNILAGISERGILATASRVRRCDLRREADGHGESAVAVQALVARAFEPKVRDDSLVSRYSWQRREISLQ